MSRPRAESAHLTDLAGRLSPSAANVSNLLIDVAGILELGVRVVHGKPRRSELVDGIQQAFQIISDIEAMAERAPSQNIDNPNTLCGRLAKNVGDVLSMLVDRLEKDTSFDYATGIIAIPKDKRGCRTSEVLAEKETHN